MIKTDLKPNTGMHIMLPVFTRIKIFMRKNYKKSIAFCAKIRYCRTVILPHLDT